MSAERWFAAAPARGDCPPALSVARQGRHTRSTWSFCHIHASYTPRHAIPKQRCYADGPCIFNLPKKARFAAEHGLYVDGDLAGSELDVSTLQHACHMLRSSGATHLLVIYDPCVPSDV